MRSISPANKGEIAGIPCYADTFVQGGSSVLRMKFCAKHPAIAPPKPYAPYLIATEQ